MKLLRAKNSKECKAKASEHGVRINCDIRKGASPPQPGGELIDERRCAPAKRGARGGELGARRVDFGGCKGASKYS